MISKPSAELLSSEALQALLCERMQGARAEVMDLGASHKKHPEAQRHGGGHFEVTLESPVFAGLSRLERSRLVHCILEPELRLGLIHALSLRLRAPGEPR